MSEKRSTAANSTPDEAIIAALKQGHRAFLRFVTRRVANMADAEDILQDFYLKVMRSARTIKERGSLRCWLAQVLRRTVMDYYRRKGVRTKAKERLRAERGPTLIVDDEAERAVCACLYRVLPTLPPDYGRIVWRVDLLGESRDRVAKDLKISANNLGVRLHRARQALRAALLRFCTTGPQHGFLNCGCEEETRVQAERAWFESGGRQTVMDRPSARLRPRTGVSNARLANRR